MLFYNVYLFWNNLMDDDVIVFLKKVFGTNPSQDFFPRI